MRSFKGTPTERRQWMNEKNRRNKERYGCISVSGGSYNCLRRLSDEHDLSISELTERIIEQSLDREVGK